MVFSSSTGSEAWIQDPFGKWSLRFHRDKKSWISYPFIFLDKGRAMEDGSPALLKSRRHLPKNEAVEIWRKLISEGWQTVEPQWSLDSEP